MLIRPLGPLLNSLNHLSYAADLVNFPLAQALDVKGLGLNVIRSWAGNSWGNTHAGCRCAPLVRPKRPAPGRSVQAWEIARHKQAGRSRFDKRELRDPVAYNPARAVSPWA